jgi:hypothetical protein
VWCDVSVKTTQCNATGFLLFSGSVAAGLCFNLTFVVRWLGLFFVALLKLEFEYSKEPASLSVKTALCFFAIAVPPAP